MSKASYELLISGLRQKGIEDERVLYAILTTPRHCFMPEDLQDYSTEDSALPIDCEQTISQPYVVARMSEAILNDRPQPKNVLEIGTGSGYQAAILAKLIPDVYTIERINHLYQQSQTVFQALKLNNIHSLFGDGRNGWPEYAPFDAILVTAACADIPEALLAQLAENGRMIIPVGDAHSQTLIMVTRTEDGYEEIVLDPVIFVPLLPGTC